MTKLSEIRTALKGNENITIVDSEVENKLDKFIYKFPDLFDNNIVETCNFRLAPKSPILDVNRLNEFMSGLVPVKPDYAINFQDLGINDIKYIGFGRLHFTEDVGMHKLSRLTVVTDPELITNYTRNGVLYTGEFENGERKENKETVIKRAINIWPYPCEAVALDKKYNYGGIERKTLERIVYGKKEKGSNLLKKIKDLF